MAKTKTVHRCTNCGATAAQWSGRCSGCQEWNTLVASAAVTTHSPASLVQLQSLTSRNDADKWSTGMSEFDRVLGGGLTPGSVTLLGGEPGVGKSTLALQLAGAAGDCIYVSGEESVHQVAQRAQRLGIESANLALVNDTNADAVASAVREHRPKLVLVDSIQTMESASVDSGAGTVGQVKATANIWVTVAKETGVAVVIVGHVTKDGTLAGPRTLEHVVDTVLEFEGDRHHGLRMLRAVKHRFGATGEVGVMEMTEKGMVAVPDASGLFLDDRKHDVSGSVVTPSLQGRRPMLVELQALVVPGNPNQCRRVAQGLEGSRLSVVLAVLHKRADITCFGDDVYASVVGGVKIDEPAADLPLALAIASSKANRSIPADIVATGELGLGGEVRRVSNMPRRLSEAARLGFRRAIVPEGNHEAPGDLELLPVGSLGEAIALINRTHDKSKERAMSGAR